MHWVYVVLLLLFMPLFVFGSCLTSIALNLYILRKLLFVRSPITLVSCVTQYYMFLLICVLL